MTMPVLRRVTVFAALAVCATFAAGAAAVEPSFSPEQLEFFETKVRPLLVRECYECHSGKSDEPKANLRLDSRAAILHGGDSGRAIVVGKPEDSNLIQAVRWLSSEMPPSGKLQPDEIAALEKWVAIGAPWPADEQLQSAAPEGRTYDWPALKNEHWAWRPIARPPLPKVANESWAKNEIDLFVAAKLAEAGLTPSPEAAPHVLLRRLYLDLIGIPPTPEELAEFERQHKAATGGRGVGPDRDQRSRLYDEAYAAVVERLLESPQYGERWGRYWLDVARYSDGYGGFLDKAGLPDAWRYRDWVVGALNDDLPYDEFVRLQIAGDLIDPQQAVATGFLALGPTYISDGGDAEATAQAKGETLDDRVDTVCRGLMGVTLACARCHDHRFDPFPQADYYGIAGVFANTRADNIPIGPPDEIAAFKAYQDRLDALQERDRELKVLVRNAKRPITKEEQREVADVKAALKTLQAEAPPPLPVLQCVTDLDNCRDMNLAIRGNLLRPGPSVPRHFLKIVAGESPAPFRSGSGRRELADAIVDPTNPLTPRVIVNRVWQQHFGFGLVRTPSNFGTLGEKPSHPELLDWLAWHFVQGSGVRGQGSVKTSGLTPVPSPLTPWSLKDLHRLIVLSAAYRQASAARDEALAVDGDNRLLWRMNPRRLDVEAWRDSLLSAAGELDATFGGPSIDDIAASNRRTLYAAVSRNGDKFAADTFLRLFDFPIPRATSEGRTQSIVPQQSLFMMNSPFMVDRAKAFAKRLEHEATDDAARIRRAYLLLYGRPVTDEELELGCAFVQSGGPTSVDNALTPWQQYAQVLLSAGEAMYWQ